MTESFSSLMNYITSVHTPRDDEDISVIAGGYVIISNDETTTIKSQENPEGVVFPRHAVEMLKSHIPSEEEDDFDDFKEHEAEERLP